MIRRILAVAALSAGIAAAPSVAFAAHPVSRHPVHGSRTLYTVELLNNCNHTTVSVQSYPTLALAQGQVGRLNILILNAGRQACESVKLITLTTR